MRKTLILAALQVAVIVAWAGYHERVRASAPTFRIPLAPRDPYDPLRGRYFVVNPLDANVKTGQAGTLISAAAVEAFLRGQKHFHGYALAGFCPAGDVHRLCALRRFEEGTPRDGFWARAFVTVAEENVAWRDGKTVPEPGWRVNTAMGIDRFFLPDALELPGLESDPSWQLEVSHRPGRPLLPKRLWFQGRPVPIGD